MSVQSLKNQSLQVSALSISNEYKSNQSGYANLTATINPTRLSVQQVLCTQIIDSTGSSGTAGQVLSVGDDGKILWITPA